MISVTPLSSENVESVESLYMIFKVTFMRSVTYAQTEAFAVNICADESVPIQSVQSNICEISSIRGDSFCEVFAAKKSSHRISIYMK